MPSQLIYIVTSAAPMHEQVLLARLATYHKELMSIDKRVSAAISVSGGDTFHSIAERDGVENPTANLIEDPDTVAATLGSLSLSKEGRDRKKRSRRGNPERSWRAFWRASGLSVRTLHHYATPSAGVTKVRSIPARVRTTRPALYRLSKPQQKPPMQDFKEITSALCDIHMILTHLVGIEITQHGTLRDKADRLEAMAFWTVNRLGKATSRIDKSTVDAKEVNGFHDLLEDVWTILRRECPDAESQERRRILWRSVKPGCDELTQTLEGLSIR